MSWAHGGTDSRPARSYYGRPVIKQPVWKPRGAVVLLRGRARRAHRLRSPSPPRLAATGCSRAEPGSSRCVALGRQPAAPDQGPRPAGALPQHAARLQADLADERRLVAAPCAADRHRALPPPTWTCSGCFPRAGRVGAPRRRSADCRSPPTPRCCSRTPPSRSGTRPGASCRSCSPAAPRRAPALRRRSSRPRATPGRRGVWSSPAR